MYRILMSGVCALALRWQTTGQPCSVRGVDHSSFLPELLVAHDLRPGVLRGGDDAHGGAALRHGSLRGGVPRQPPSVWRHDRRGHAHQQDGPRATEGEGRAGRVTREVWRPGLGRHFNV